MNDRARLLAERASNLADTGAKLALGLAEGLLGNAHQRKNRGRWVELAPGGSGQVLAVTGDDQLAAGCQVACSLKPVGSAAAGLASMSIPPVLGVLRWGTDGVQHELEFDFVQGVVFSVAGSYLEVTARNLAPADGETALSVQAGGALGYFPHSRPLRRSFSARDVEAADIFRCPVPPFARTVEAIRSPQGAVILVCEDLTGFPLAMVSTVGPAVLPIVPETAQVAIFNSSGATMNQITAAFDLWV